MQVAAERNRIGDEGWGARLLALQGDDGQWRSGVPDFPSAAAERWWQSLPPERKGTLFPEWTSTTWSLTLLRRFGLDPNDARARNAVRLIRKRCRWQHDGEPYFAGETEPCINGRTVANGAYFGEDVGGVVDRLLGEQMRDGGWNCEGNRMYFPIDAGEGRPGRWNTLRALRVLRWYDARTP